LPRASWRPLCPIQSLLWRHTFAFPHCTRTSAWNWSFTSI